MGRRTLEESSDGTDEAEEGLWLSEYCEDALEKYVWHFDMLHHTVRNLAFEDAFRRLPSSCLAGVALDIGCGSGLLGLMLLAQRPECANLRVFSIEGDKEMARVAADNVQANGLTHRVEVRNCLSTRMRSLNDVKASRKRAREGAPVGDAGGRSPLVVCEILDSPLLGEGVLATLRHAAGSLLLPGYHAVPCCAEIWGAVVESNFIEGMQRWTAPDCFLPAPTGWRKDCGDARSHEVNFAQLLKSGKVRKLTSDFMPLVIDFEALPPEEGQHNSIDVVCESEGRIDAVVFWWRCAMVRGDTFDHQPAGMNNAPTEPGETDHWRQAVCILPAPRGGRLVTAQERLRIFASHDDELVWFRVEHVGGAAKRSAVISEVVPRCPSEPHAASSTLEYLSSWRLRMLNDAERRQSLRLTAIDAVASFARAASGVSGREPLLVDLSEGALMAQLCISIKCPPPRKRPLPLSRRHKALLKISRAHRLRRARESAPRFIAVGDGQRQGREMLKALWASRGLKRQLDRGMPRLAFRPDSWAPASQSVDALIGEPYDSSVEERECDLQLWQHWARVDEFLPALRPDGLVWPARFRLRVAVIACRPLWRRRQPIGSVLIGGANVSCIDRLASERYFPWAASDDLRSRHPCELWQQEHAVLGCSGSRENSPGTVLCEVDVQQPLRALSFEELTLDISVDSGGSTGAEEIHALATWTEVSVGSAWRSSAAFETRPDGTRRFAPGPFKQGVLLARSPRARGQARLSVRSEFNPACGELRLAARWSDGRDF